MNDLTDLNEIKISAILTNLSEETTKIELKEIWPNSTSLEQTMCAMANAEGGLIIIGVSNDHRIIGIEDRGELSARISGIIGNSNPLPVFDSKKISVDSEKHIAVIQVFPSVDKPLQSANGAFHFRMQGKNAFIPRAQLTDIFILKDLKKTRKMKLLSILRQAIRNIGEETGTGGALKNGNRSIVFEKFLIPEIMNEIHNYPYFSEELGNQTQLDRIFELCNLIQQRKKEFETEKDVLLQERYGSTYRNADGFIHQLQ